MQQKVIISDDDYVAPHEDVISNDESCCSTKRCRALDKREYLMIMEK